MPPKMWNDSVLAVPDSVTGALEYLRGKVLHGGGLNTKSWPWASLGRSWMLEINLLAVKLEDLWLEVLPENPHNCTLNLAFTIVSW